MSVSVVWSRVVCAVLLAAGLLGIPTPAPAYAALVSAPYRAGILLRSLGYERGILAGKGNIVVLVIRGADAASQADGREMSGTFAALATRMTVGNRKIDVRALQHGDTRDTVAAVAALKPNAVYFASGVEGLAAQLAREADAAHWVSMCADGAQLGRGCAIAVRPLGEASQLVVDLVRARQAGLSFDSRLLRIAQVLQ